MRNRVAAALVICTSLMLAVFVPLAQHVLAEGFSLSWTQRASLLVARSHLGAAAGANGKIYAIGGQTFASDGSTSITGSVEAYDPATNTWTPRARMPTPRLQPVVVAASDDKIYAIGGRTHLSPFLNVVEAYDPATDTWESRAPLPSPSIESAGAQAANGKIYIMGGEQGTAILEYDPSENTWVSKGPLPTRRFQFALVALPSGKLLAIGGDTGAENVPLSNVDEYDPATGQWTAKASMPTARTVFGAVLAPNGRVYVVGGIPRTRQGGCCIGTTASVEEYDPVTNQWLTTTSLPSPRAFHGVALGANGKIYAIGGWEASDIVIGLTPLARVDEATIALDATAPTITSLTVNGGALATTSVQVTLGLAVDEDPSGLKDMSFSNDGTTWTNWEPFAATKEWTLPASDGQKTVLARVRDFAENVSATQTATVTLDRSLGADWGMTINDAASWTSSLNVTLRIAARPGTARMQVSNDGGFFGAQWEPYTSTKAWQMLAPPRPDLITEVVYVRFGDAAGNVITGSRVEDSIFLDAVPPSGSLSIASGDAVQGPVRQLNLTANDDLSGLNGMQISNRADFAGARWQDFASSVSWNFADGGTVFARFRDVAGNLSPTYSQSLPGAAPPGTSLTPSCTPRPPVQVRLQKDSGSLVATLTTSGANNGLRAVRFDSFTTALVDVGDQLGQSAPFAVSIPAGQEPTSLQFTVRRAPGSSTATVRLVVVDGCGEWSTFVGGGSGAW